MRLQVGGSQLPAAQAPTRRPCWTNRNKAVVVDGRKRRGEGQANIPQPLRMQHDFGLVWRSNHRPDNRLQTHSGDCCSCCRHFQDTDPIGGFLGQARRFRVINFQVHETIAWRDCQISTQRAETGVSVLPGRGIGFEFEAGPWSVSNMS